MDLKLKNKLALVTGSTAGIGFAIAKLLAEEGAKVVINGRTQQRVDDALKKISSIQPDADLIGFAADLGKDSSFIQLFNEIQEVDILINNLGIYEVKPFGEINDTDWVHLFNVNVMSGVRLSRFYLPKMLTQNWGRVIFISSESGLQIPPEMIHYGVTKTAQIALARGLAETTAGTQVTVNSVLPGPTRSEGVENFIENIASQSQQTPEQIEQAFFASVRPSSLLQRFTTTDEVAALVAYLASPISSGTNGAAMRVEGGAVRFIA